MQVPVAFRAMQCNTCAIPSTASLSWDLKIFVLDVHKESKYLKMTTTGKPDFDASLLANTTTYGPLVSGKLIYLESDGNKFNSVLTEGSFVPSPL